MSEESIFCNCHIHGEYDPMAWYEEDEIEEMLKESGQIDCPMCMAEIVGIE